MAAPLFGQVCVCVARRLFVCVCVFTSLPPSVTGVSMKPTAHVRVVIAARNRGDRFRSARNKTTERSQPHPLNKKKDQKKSSWCHSNGRRFLPIEMPRLLSWRADAIEMADLLIRFGPLFFWNGVKSLDRPVLLEMDVVGGGV